MSYIQCWVNRLIDVGPLLGQSETLIPYYVADLANIYVFYDNIVREGEWVSDGKQFDDEAGGVVCPDQPSC